jgi:hypothetical protein
MKRFILTLFLISLSSGAIAHDRHYHRHNHRLYDRSMYWIVPTMAGVVVGTVVTRNYYHEPIYTPPPVYVERRRIEPQCSGWREIQQEDGTITRERYCY